MLSASELYYVDQRLNKIICNDLNFFGVCVGLIGDPVQLTCVTGYPLWCVPSGITNYSIYI